jgi:hypothetical protein
MTYIMVDVKADGPIPGDFSMVCFGAIVVEPSLDRTFYGRLKPISEKWIPEALQVSGFTREETLDFDDPKSVMQQFVGWVAEVSSGRPMFISDILEVETGRTTFLEGWGIHWSPWGGGVWNIWGYDCVLLRLKRGKLKIGTDDAEGLAELVSSRIRSAT